MGTRNPQSGIQNHTDPQSAIRSPRVLVTDNSPTVRKQVKKLLGDAGFEVLLTEDGRKCLKVLEAERPDAILLDAAMSGIDGIEVCRKIKSNSRLQDIPVLILTTAGDAESKLKGLSAGANDFVVKPFEVEELMARIGSALRTRQLLEDLKREIDQRKRVEKELQRLLDDFKQSQAQLIQTAKMSAVGTMTAGIAHELNNPLMGILNFIQYSIKPATTDEKRYLVLQDAARETKRCIDIVKDLLTFSRMESDEDAFQRKSCAQIIGRVIRILSYRTEKQNVSVTQHVAERTPEIWTNVNHIQQVFFNLMLNALDALSLEENGKEEKRIHVDVSREGEFVRVSIEDNGSGIAPEHFPKVFDPFFTTKPVGSGTGLGLSISRNIVHAYGGEITCESVYGEGAKFRILLPAEPEQQRRKRNEHAETHLGD